MSGSPAHSFIHVDDESGESLLVSFSPRELPLVPEPITKYLPGARLWRTVTTVGEYYESPPEVFASVMDYPSPELDNFLLAVADDVVGDAIIGPPDLAWLFCPYDGGVDVMAPSRGARDRLALMFSDWEGELGGRSLDMPWDELE
jgi:hypothetical protein